jgi:ABC-type transport system involved in multi-copper enzyme maturation permease subunit
MLTVFWHTLRESVHRRMGLVLIVFAVLLPAAQLAFIRFETQADGSMIAYAGRFVHRDVPKFVQSNLQGLLQMTASLWVFLGIFAGASLLSSYLERGATDLLLSKGVPRWQFFLGRWLGALGLFVLVIAVMNGGTAMYYWARTGVEPWRFLASLLLPTLSMAAALALMALGSLAQPNTGLLIVVAFLQMSFSQLLFSRQQGLYTVITAQWARTLIDWAYRILPKNFELVRDANRFLGTGVLDSWWSVWSTGVFIIVVLGASLWFLHRKSF